MAEASNRRERPQILSSSPNGQSKARRQPAISCTNGAGFAGGGVGGAGGSPGAAKGGEALCKGGVSPVFVAESGGFAKRGVTGLIAPLTGRLRRGTYARMSALPPCPYLPPAREGLDWRALNAFRESERGAGFYLTCLEYGQVLWQRRLAARAMLCLDRAMGAELGGSEPVLREWPMPYAAMRWIVAQAPAEVFVGNPRVHFQHYADRMNEPRREQRRWRAWACWALVRVARPDYAADPRHRVVEPQEVEIAAGLRLHGLPDEEEVWQAVLSAPV